MDRPCVIVTRPRAQADDWVRALVSRGLDAQALPLIDIGPAAEPELVREAWHRLPALHFVMFVSANAVEQFFALRPPGTDWPPGLAAGSTGQGTSVALRGCGVSPALIAQPAPGERSESEALWRQIARRSWAGKQVLVVRGEDGRDWLAQQFQQAGAKVTFLAAYRRRPPAWTSEQAAFLNQALAAPQEHVWLFSSSEAVGHLRDMASGADWSSSRAVATHPRIAQAAREAGFAQVVVAEPAVEAIHASCAHLESRAP